MKRHSGQVGGGGGEHVERFKTYSYKKHLRSMAVGSLVEKDLRKT